MTVKWPTLSGSYTRAVTIIHAQAWAGNPEPHPHEMRVTFHWRHEINPRHGHTWPLSETQRHVERLLARVDGKYLNPLVGVDRNPTAETLAVWLMVRSPAFYHAISIDCYDGYHVHLERKDIPEFWARDYLGADSIASLTA